MRNPLLTNGQRTMPLSQWKRELRGLTFERDDVNYHVLDHNLHIRERLVNISTTPRKQYMRQYMKQRRFHPGVKVSELAQIKKVNRTTILRHLNKFDIISREPLILIKYNYKIFNWRPK